MVEPRVLVVLFSVLLACADEGGPVDDPSCSTGVRWSGGGDSPMMHPGRDCNGCHGKGVARVFDVVGTIYDVPHEKDECFGIPDVTVRLQGADARVLELVTNDAGNLEREQADVASPYTVVLELEGRQLTGVTPHDDLDCAGCHTREGERGAAGRILAP